MLVNKRLFLKLNLQERDSVLESLQTAADSHKHFSLFSSGGGVVVSTHDTVKAAKESGRGEWTPVYIHNGQCTPITAETLKLSRIARSLGLPELAIRLR